MLTPEDRREKLDCVVDVAETQLTTLAETRAIFRDLLATITGAGEKSPICAATLLSVVEDEEVRNVTELSALFRAESACLIGDYWCASGFRKSLYARMLVLVTYETTLTFRGLLGPTFRNAVVSRLGDDVDSQLADIHQRVCEIYERNRSAFGDVRNNLIGHRSGDGERRQGLLQDFDAELAVARAVELHPILTELTTLLAPYTAQSNAALREVQLSLQQKLLDP